MSFPDSFLTHHRHHRIESDAASVLTDLCTHTPLYFHARNWMAEMATITKLSESIRDEEADTLFFPEQGLHISLPAIQHLHTVAIEHRSRASLALEIATRGEPRAISIAAIPHLSDLSAFSGSLAHQPTQPLTVETYDRWRESHIVRPSICPCCAKAAEDRRKNPENNPLSRVFCQAIEQGMTLHCQLSSIAFRFTREIAPGHLIFQNGHITLTSQDGCSMLEIDPGFCHSLTLHRRCIDAEPMTSLRIYSSLGVPELTIDTHGWNAYKDWLGICRMS